MYIVEHPAKSFMVQTHVFFGPLVNWLENVKFLPAAPQIAIVFFWRLKQGVIYQPPACLPEFGRWLVLNLCHGCRFSGVLQLGRPLC